jgi:hypothetical protein
MGEFINPEVQAVYDTAVRMCEDDSSADSLSIAEETGLAHATVESALWDVLAGTWLNVKSDPERIGAGRAAIVNSVEA